MIEEDIARICHEANRAYCATLYDNSQPRWEDAPEWQKKSAIDGVNFHLNALKRGEFKTPKESHESWMAAKTLDGWKYGPVKDPEKKEHPCYVPYEELPYSQKVKDYIFSGIVKAVYDSTKD